MLLDTMNYAEINAEVYREYHKLIGTTVVRLGMEYDRERKNFKIDKARTYSKAYTIKTAGKNNWLIVISKQPSIVKYDGFKTLTASCVTYYYNKKGLRFLIPTANQRVLIIFNAHFFERYNERLGLNLSKHIDMAKHFLQYNNYAEPTLIEKDERKYMMAVSKYGLMLGELNEAERIAIWKTFISPDIVRQDQNELENELLFKLLVEIGKTLNMESVNKILRTYPF